MDMFCPICESYDIGRLPIGDPYFEFQCYDCDHRGGFTEFYEECVSRTQLLWQAVQYLRWYYSRHGKDHRKYLRVLPTNAKETHMFYANRFVQFAGNKMLYVKKGQKDYYIPIPHGAAHG